MAPKRNPLGVAPLQPMASAKRAKTHTVEYNGYSYATLDSANPSGMVGGGDPSNEFVPLPDGWELVPEDADIIKHVVEPYSWSGATGVILATGGSCCTKHWASEAGAGIILRGKKALADFRGRVPGTDVKIGYKSNHKNVRFLIRRACPSSAGFEKSLGADLYAERLFTDCIISCGAEDIKCHRAVLARASPVLSRMLSTEMSEGINQRIEMNEAKVASVQALVSFMYLGKLEAESVDVTEVLSLADYYSVEPLVEVAAKKALEIVDLGNITAVVLAFKCLAGKEESAWLWDALVQELSDRKELLAVLMKNA